MAVVIDYHNYTPLLKNGSERNIVPDVLLFIHKILVNNTIHMSMSRNISVSELLIILPAYSSEIWVFSFYIMVTYFLN